MPTKVYAYAAKVMNGTEEIAEQISAAHKYYNQLIELRRAYSAERDRLIRVTCPDYDSAQIAVEEADIAHKQLVDAARAANAKAKRKRATPEEVKAIQAAYAVLKDSWAAHKVTRELVRDDVALQALLEQLNIDFNGVLIENSDRRKGGKFKDAREACGVYWGTYLKIEASVEQAVKRFGEPRFRSWDGSGQIAVQVQNGGTFSNVLSGAGRIGSFVRFVYRQQRSKHRVPWMTFKLRVKTSDKNKPIWCEVRTAWTRELPNDAKIMGVTLVRIPRGVFRTKAGYIPQYDWSLQFTVRTTTIKPRASAGVCGIDIGWRWMEDDSLCVAYYVGDDGKHSDLRLSPALIKRWDKSEAIQGNRDKDFNAAMASLIDWKASLVAPPEWFAEATKFCAKWESKEKLRRLLDQWSKNRIVGDEAIYEKLCEWRARDVHLEQYARFNQYKAQRIRKQLYLKFAADLRKRYGTIAVEDFVMTKKLTRKKRVTDNTFDPTKRPMRIASVGLLRQIFVNDGAIKFESAFTTKMCHLCGSIEDWDQAKELCHTCSQCSAFWNQDFNAAMNLLASGEAWLTGVSEVDQQANAVDESEVPPTDTPYVGRWAKRKIKRAQKKAGILTEQKR